MVEIDEVTLRNILALKPGEPLPEALVETYDNFKLGWDRLGGGSVAPRDLVMIVVASGVKCRPSQPKVERKPVQLPNAFEQELDELPEEEAAPEPVAEGTDWKAVAPGTQVYFQAGGNTHSALFVEPEKNGLLLQIGEEMTTVPADRVRLAE
jgi:hypothetical protein